MQNRTLGYSLQVDSHFFHTAAVLKNELLLPKQQEHQQGRDRYQQ